MSIRFQVVLWYSSQLTNNVTITDFLFTTFKHLKSKEIFELQTIIHHPHSHDLLTGNVRLFTGFDRHFRRYENDPFFLLVKSAPSKNRYSAENCILTSCHEILWFNQIRTLLSIIIHFHFSAYFQCYRMSFVFVKNGTNQLLFNWQTFSFQIKFFFYFFFLQKLSNNPHLIIDSYHILLVVYHIARKFNFLPFMACVCLVYTLCTHEKQFLLFIRKEIVKSHHI